MPKINYSDDNVFPRPAGSFVRNKVYLYVNTSSFYVPAKNGKKGHCDHDSISIGKVKDDNTFYANNNYYRLFHKDMLPLPPEYSDSLSVGSLAVIRNVCQKYKLFNILREVFDYEETCKIIDLASYMIVRESAIMQHFPGYCRDHARMMNVHFDDTEISRFLNETLTMSKIKQFKEAWAKANIGDGHVFFCYDSTNENSDAQGVTIVEKGHAKDDPTRSQVNTDYVVRQCDGLPITFNNFPGSIVDMMEAKEMISYMQEVTSFLNIVITMIADRGYISEENIDDMDHNNIDFLLLLKDNMSDSARLLDEYGSSVHQYKNRMEDKCHYGIKVKGKLFGNGKDRYFYLIWDETLEKKHRDRLASRLDDKVGKIKKAIDRKTQFTSAELKDQFGRWFKLDIEEYGTIKIKSRGRGKKGQTKEEISYRITGFETNDEAINKDMTTCGVKILVSSKELTLEEAYEAYQKRDCIEKVFRALKNSLGMDVIGVHSEDNIQGKSLIWFVASIIRSILQKDLKKLQTTSNAFTVPMAMEQLEAIKADKNLNTGKYERRYQLTSKQKKIFDALGIQYTEVDETIDELN